MKKLIALLLAMALACGLLAGCSGSKDPQPSNDPTPSASTPSETGEPSQQPAAGEPDGIVPGTVLNVAWDSDKQTHLPYTSDSHGTLYMMLYDTLFQNNDGVVSGLIAKDWTISEDGMQYVINIWDNIDYCMKDGTKGAHLNADKVVRSLALTEKYMSNYFTNIASYEATGEYQITVTFSAPYPDFQVQFSSMFTGIVDPDLVAQYGEESNDAAVGTGPYYLAEYVGSTSFTFKANPYYWDAERCAHIETVNALIISEDATRQMALRSGDVDWIEVSDVLVMESLTASGEFSACESQGAFNPLYFNCNRAPFNDERVRRGLGLLIDSQELVNVAYGGEGDVWDGLWQEKCITYKKYDDFNKCDPDEGLKLLSEAGIDPNTLVINTIGSYLDTNYLPALQAQLAKYGITLNFEIYEVGTFIQSISQGNYDVIAWFGICDPAAPYQTYLNMFSANGFYRPLQIDQTYPEIWAQIQDILAEAGQCTTIEEQAVVLQQIDELLVANCIVTHNVGGREWKVYNSKLQNMQSEAKYAFTELNELYWAD